MASRYLGRIMSLQCALWSCLLRALGGKLLHLRLFGRPSLLRLPSPIHPFPIAEVSSRLTSSHAVSLSASLFRSQATSRMEALTSFTKDVSLDECVYNALLELYILLGMDHVYRHSTKQCSTCRFANIVVCLVYKFTYRQTHNVFVSYGFTQISRQV